MAKAYLIRNCHATWNEDDGWNCDCKGKHPTLCSPIVEVLPCEFCGGLGWVVDICDQGHYGHTEQCTRCGGTGEKILTIDEHLEEAR